MQLTGLLFRSRFRGRRKGAQTMIISHKISVQAITALLAALAVIVLMAVISSPAAAAVSSYVWATQGGGSSSDAALGISAVPGGDGSSIITGGFNGTASFGTTTLTSAGAFDTVAAKVNADGSYAWATKGGGAGNDGAYGVSALPDGSSIITGGFNGTATFGTTTLTSAGVGDTFTAKINANGSYAWAIKGGGTGEDTAYSVSALPDGSSIITGQFSLRATFGATELLSTGSFDTFTAKVNADGTYAWAIRGGGLAVRGGGSGSDIAWDVSSLADGSSIITGQFSFTASFGTTNLTSAGLKDTFTAKVNADGSYAWATKGGGADEDSANGVSTFADGSSIITGRFNGTATFGSTTLVSTGSYDTFTAKLNADGTYVWAIKGGGLSSDYAYGVSTLADGSSIITGFFSNTVTFGTTTLTSDAGSLDTFTAKVNSNGTYAWATKGGGTGDAAAYGVSALADGSSIIAGTFDGIAAFGTTTFASIGSNDAFTARILSDAPQAPTGASASAGIREATITWNAVAGGSVSSYTATAAPGGATCTALAPAATCTITVRTGSSYTATVTATNSHGTSPPSQASNAVTPTAPVNTFTIKTLKIWPKKITTQLNLPGPGKVTQVGTTKLTKKARTTIVCTARKTIATAGKVTITCRLSAKARAARKKHSLKLRLVTTFTPTGGTAKSVSKTLVLKKTR